MKGESGAPPGPDLPPILAEPGALTLGIEEEYLLVDLKTRDLVEAPEALMSACADEMSDQVSPEFLQCQIEIGTRVMPDIASAREELRWLRRSVADCAAAHGMAPIAVSCHPFADWKDQRHTRKDRYNALARDLGGVAERLLICGCHVHVGIGDDDLRIDLMGQLSYFLPHLLALSTSSPFWQGRDTGLSSYRLTVFDNLPRTGLPPVISSWGEYQRSLGVLTGLELIEDASKIWWDLRPSHAYPTLETRICDVQPRLEDTLTLAALVQCLTRMLLRLKHNNQRWRIYDPFLVQENRWRAQRYGTEQGLIDFGRRALVPMVDLVEELIVLLGDDADALGCREELEGMRRIVSQGNSASRQRAVFHAAEASGASKTEAWWAVVDDLITEFREGL
ncbi:MAG: carboxylate-amine ligase [Pseudomonadota bacterium]